ncbi:N-methyl-L-tryptophan oxidase [Solicola gregarius]|uniref:N-methyl-L-tryptophan oxidase n=1 Tax=Solicola gregarius TaxID=2908642 RepID=A0AA46YLS7_9ACTN|nr:N-methyl-L-tryptophan oxidase [Solicola gregarius]UYM07260.1 N-methyl-L-tryptophan oxidase [Solicola gregarius]
MVVRCDVAVVGLGAMGAMSLWQLAERGVSVVGVERYDIAHPYGSSHGASRIYRSILFEGAEYVPIARRSLELWRELERAADAPLLTTTGGLSIGTDGGELVADAVKSADAGEVAYELLDVDALRTRFPQHATFDDDIGVYEREAGSVNPELAIRAAVARAVDRGARVETGTVVSSIEFGTDRVVVACADNVIEARTVIVSAGPWFNDLVPELALPLRNQRSILSWFSGGSGYGPDRFPTFVRESHDLQGWGIPDLDGSGVKIGISGQPKPWLDRPEDNRTPVTPGETQPIESFCRMAFPGLLPRVVRAEPCINSKTPDGDFVVGTTARAPGAVLVGGFSGHGFKHAAGIGSIAADLAVEGATDIPVDRFDPDRFDPVRLGGPEGAGA